MIGVTQLLNTGLTSISYPIDVDFLVIGGGGSGNPGGGGGGAGGYRTSYGTGNISGRNSPVETALSITNNTNYTVTVGEGGAPAATSPVSSLHQGGNAGEDSVFSTITSLGGGCASYYPSAANGGYTAKHNGGSGGGATFGGSGGHNAGNTSGTTAQGFGGHGGGLSGASTWSGGGGGAGAAGNNTGTGGVGLASSITGTSVNRGGGGSPGPWMSGTRASNGFGGGAGGNATSGTPNTGGGGGGGGSSSQSESGLRAAGSGGSGVVIIRFTNEASYTVSSGLTYTETLVDNDKVVTFTAGTGTIAFS